MTAKRSGAIPAHTPLANHPTTTLWQAAVPGIAGTLSGCCRAVRPALRARQTVVAGEAPAGRPWKECLVDPTSPGSPPVPASRGADLPAVSRGRGCCAADCQAGARLNTQDGYGYTGRLRGIVTSPGYAMHITMIVNMDYTQSRQVWVYTFGLICCRNKVVFFILTTRTRRSKILFVQSSTNQPWGMA